MDKLVVVESPTKAKTLSRFLGEKFKVLSSKGHIRDLPKSELGVDVEHDFKPQYLIVKGKKKVVQELKKAAKDAKVLFLATDPDREGEAIAYHLSEVLGSKSKITPRPVRRHSGSPRAQAERRQARGDTEQGRSVRNQKLKIKRVVFHEITEDAIKEAFEHPRDLNLKLIDSQQARRILDRLVGYKLSPLLWKKVRYGLSAGRVQSVAVRLIVEREREREASKPEEYWEIEAELQSKQQTTCSKPADSSPASSSAAGETPGVSADLTPGVKEAASPAGVKEAGVLGTSTVSSVKPRGSSVGAANPFRAKLVEREGETIHISEKTDLFDGAYTITSTSIGDKEEARGVVSRIQDLKFSVAKVESRDQRRSPYPPFTTSTLQQAAVNVLGFSAKRTMRAAQNLYEAGLITYHRTDSVTLGDRALKEIREFIGSNYGSNYLPKSASRYKTKVRLAQEAHEAIRPTDVGLNPTGLGSSTRRVELGGDERKLYELIWRRTVACQMADAVLALTRVDIEVGDYGFKANGSQIKFDGFLKVFGKSQETILPKLEVGDELTLVSLEPTQHFTPPPPRYTEASLIKSLEKKGIGRPSTYAPIISTIQSRGYVSKEGKQLRPEDVGIVVNDLLVAYFPDIVDPSFTAKMEHEFDEIARGKREWVPLLREFYGPFAEDLEEAQKNVEKSSITILKETDEKCPECSKLLVIKLGKYGRFYSCSGFPECKFSKPFIEKIGMGCPGCGEGEVIVRRTKRGKIFYGCSRYPECRWASWKDPRKDQKDD